jgi:hypothetical protein
VARDSGRIPTLRAHQEPVPGTEKARTTTWVHLRRANPGWHNQRQLRCPAQVDDKPRLGVKCNHLLGKFSLERTAPVIYPLLDRLVEIPIQRPD